MGRGGKFHVREGEGEFKKELGDILGRMRRSLRGKVRIMARKVYNKEDRCTLQTTDGPMHGQRRGVDVDKTNGRVAYSAVSGGSECTSGYDGELWNATGDFCLNIK